MVCGVAVSPGVPIRSARESGVRSRTRVLDPRARGELGAAGRRRRGPFAGTNPGIQRGRSRTQDSNLSAKEAAVTVPEPDVAGAANPSVRWLQLPARSSSASGSTVISTGASVRRERPAVPARMAGVNFFMTRSSGRLLRRFNAGWACHDFFVLQLPLRLSTSPAGSAASPEGSPRPRAQLS